MKYVKKITAAALSVLLLGSLAAPAIAETEPSAKEEVIYIMTDGSGKVTDIEAVNIFGGGNITDYGDYTAVKMLNTTDKITQSGDKITLTSAADKVYYQGTLKNTAIPWNISVRYFLDGKEYSAKDIAGKSGALEIRFSVSKNENCKGSFYDDYALQASFTLNTDLCKNIVSSGATAANVGSNKQLTYTVLPGKGIETVIKADVTNFEMDAVAINGVRLNMNFEVDDSVLTDKVNELVSATDKLNSGAKDVRDGTGKLNSATETLNGKVGELNSGVAALTGGAGELYSGLSDITAKNGQLTAAAYTAYEGLCNAAAAALNSQLTANGMAAVTLTPANYSEVLMELLKKMNADTAHKVAYQTVLQQISGLKEQLDSYGEFYQGLLDYTGAVSSAAQGAKELKLNMDALYTNTGKLKISVGEMTGAVGELYGGTKELANGTAEFSDKTSNIDEQISDEIDTMISSVTGNNAETVSFISEKNTNVNSVQFVIKTAAVEKAEAEVSNAAKETKLTFWQKLLRLFGLY